MVLLRMLLPGRIMFLLSLLDLLLALSLFSATRCLNRLCIWLSNNWNGCWGKIFQTVRYVARYAPLGTVR